MFKFSEDEAKQALLDKFGHHSFRGCQLEVISRIAQGGHSLVIMPTGMGKSICFQIPAVLQRRSLDDDAMTLVLSPLVALMKDQVDGLNAKGIDAAYVNSSLSKSERNERYNAIGANQFDLLYVTPERFRKSDFLEVISQRKICLLAVDEAHCISEWGHDFRPDYTRVGDIRHQLGSPTTIALTATATPEVQVDIARQLRIDGSNIKLFHEGIERPNLILSVKQVWTDEEKLQSILDTRQQETGSGIVYFTLIRKLMEFSDLLSERGVDHLIYHGDLDRINRKRIQDCFMNEDGTLVLATNAFGMGIDKEDIRFVMHADLPGSLESYYQEIGRAGRDGKPSMCQLLYDERDLATQMEFLTWSNPDAQYYQRLHEILRFEIEKINSFGMEWLRERLHHKQKHDRRLETALAMLDRWSVTSGSLENQNLNCIDELPDRFNNPQQTSEKLKRDQTKLLRMMQYAKHDGNLKQFIDQYFGLDEA